MFTNNSNFVVLRQTAPRSLKISLPLDCDELLYEQQYSPLLNSTLNDQSKARLSSVVSAEAGAWLNVLPVPSLGIKLDDESLRIAFGLSSVL